jgi:hypothetical protein
MTSEATDEISHSSAERYISMRVYTATSFKTTSIAILRGESPKGRPPRLYTKQAGEINYALKKNFANYRIKVANKSQTSSSEISGGN